MRLLLDTHILLWGAIEPERLSRVASALIESPDNEIVFSALSIWKIAIKTGLGRADFRIAAGMLRRSFSTMVMSNSLSPAPMPRRWRVCRRFTRTRSTGCSWLKPSSRDLRF